MLFTALLVAGEIIPTSPVQEIYQRPLQRGGARTDMPRKYTLKATTFRGLFGVIPSYSVLCSYTVITHICNPGISFNVQYLLIFCAPNVCTSSSRCFQSTSPKASINLFTSALSSSASPVRQSSKYLSNSTSPAWIFLCCCRRSNSLRNSGIFFARTGKTCCSSMEWWKSSWEQKARPVRMSWRGCFCLPMGAQAFWRSFQTRRKWLCCIC